MPIPNANLVTLPGQLVTTNALQANQINGNIIVANTYYLANGNTLSPIGSGYGNSNVASFMPNYGGDVLANNIFGYVQYPVQNNITSVGTLDYINTDGNLVVVGATTMGNTLTITHGNLNLLDGATGNIYTEANIVAKEQIYSGSNVQAQDYLVGNNLLIFNSITTANIYTDGYFYSNGVPFTGANISNVQIDGVLASFLPVYTGNIGAGNVNAGFLYGDGSQISNLPTLDNYGNANVAAYLPTYTGSLIPSFVNASGNVRGSNFNTTGNVSGNYILGNGAFLTGVASSYGNADVAAYLPTYTGDIGANTITANLFIGTFDGNVTGNIIIPGPNTGIVFNEAGEANSSPNLTFNPATNLMTVAGNINATYYIGNGSKLTGMYGNAQVSNYLASGTDTANIATTGYFVGDGSQLTNLPIQPGLYGNSNVITLLSAYSANINTNAAINTSDMALFGNTIASYGNITLDPAADSGVVGTVFVLGNMQVAGELTSISSNTITIDSLLFEAANNSPNPSAANGGGLAVGPSGTPYATWTFDSVGNAWLSNLPIEASSFIGSAANLTGLYGNANVADYLAAGTTANIVTTGNVSGTYFLGNGSQLTGIPPGYTDANVSAYLAGGTDTANIITTGNISGSYILGNGALLTGIATGSSNAIVNGASNVSIPTANGAITFGMGFGGTSIPSGYIDQNVTALGYGSSYNLGGAGSVAIGRGINTNVGQGQAAIAVGDSAAGGGTAQGAFATAIGYQAGSSGQGLSSISIGRSAGFTTQGAQAVAIGYNAGQQLQGANAIAIGYNTGLLSQPAGSIGINATGADIVGTNVGLYIAPVRNDTGNTTQTLYYNTTTSEITYAAVGSSSYGDANVEALLSSGTVTSNIITTGNVTTTATQYGNFTITESNDQLVFTYNGANIAIMSNTGNLSMAQNVTAFDSI